MRPERLPVTAVEPERLHKFIAACGLASRRKAEEMILEGRVQVNGEIITQLGTKVGPGDEVQADGVTLVRPKLYYVLMNKPKGVVTTLDDPQRRPTVARYLPDMGVTLKPVGRLDMDTEGLLLFTNDGEFALRMTHPRHKVPKEYQATVFGKPEEKALERLRKGVTIEGRRTAPAEVDILRYDPSEGRTLVRVVIREGRKRQVRLMFDAIGHPAQALKRVRIGPLVLRNMPAGMCRMLGKAEVDTLKRLVGMET